MAAVWPALALVVSVLLIPHLTDLLCPPPSLPLPPHRPARRCAPAPRNALSPYAPRIRQFILPLEKIGMAIGPGGRTIKLIQDTTGVEVQVRSLFPLSYSSKTAGALGIAQLCGGS